MRLPSPSVGPFARFAAVGVVILVGFTGLCAVFLSTAPGGDGPRPSREDSSSGLHPRSRQAGAATPTPGVLISRVVRIDEDRGSEEAAVGVPVSASISVVKEWSGPEFLRHFAHDPAGAQHLQTALHQWLNVNSSVAAKVARLGTERAELGKRGDWNRAEIDFAIQWVRKLPDSETRFALLAELGKRLLAFDRPAAALLSEGFARALHRHAYLAEVADEWAETDPEASSAWVEAFPEGELRDTLQMKVAIRCAERWPAAAAEYVARLNPGSSRDAAAQTVTRQWAAADPRAAAEWAATYPGEELRPELLRTAVAYWSRKDLGSMRRWLKEDPADPIRQAAAELEATIH